MFYRTLCEDLEVFLIDLKRAEEEARMKVNKLLQTHYENLTLHG